MYPSWLVPSMTFISVETAKAGLMASPDGSFALVKAYKQATDAQGKPRTREWAMANAGGNAYFADILLKETDESKIFIVAKDKGATSTKAAPCSHLMRFTSLEAFCADFSKATGIQIDPKLLDHPAKNYMFWDA